MNKSWNRTIRGLVFGGVVIGLVLYVLYSAPMWLQLFDLMDPVPFLMKKDYRLKQIKILGQERELLCTNTNVLKFFKIIFQNYNFGAAPGPPNVEQDGIDYIMTLYYSGGRWIRLAVWFDMSGTMFMVGNLYSDDDKMYWFRIPKKRPKEFEQCLKFLLNEQNRGRTLVIK